MPLLNESPLNTSPFNSGTTEAQQEAALTLVEFTQTNSTTYADLLGILLGLERIAGEPSDAFVARLREAAAINRSGEYIGLLNEIRLQFGLPLQKAFRVEADTASFDVQVNAAGLSLVSLGGSITAPLLEVDRDGFWNWKTVGDVVDAINQSNGKFSATLLIDKDTPALVLCRQENSNVVTGETVSGRTVRLKKSTLVEGSEQFNADVPPYLVSADQTTLYFESPLPEGIQASYKYRSCPYTVVSCPVALLGLMDSAVRQVARTPDQGVVRQVQEVLNAVLFEDRSYWAK